MLINILFCQTKNLDSIIVSKALVQQQGIELTALTVLLFLNTDLAYSSSTIKLIIYHLIS